MSLCFAYIEKYNEGVYIAADGRRIGLQFNKRGNLEPNGTITSEEYRKVRPLTNKSCLFIGGVCEITEKMYDEIRSMVNSDSTFEEIVEVIQNVSRKYHSLSGLTGDADKTSSSASVLAYYDNKIKARIVGLSPCNNYEPIIFQDEGNYGFKGDLIGEQKGNKFVQNNPRNKNERFSNYTYRIYQHITKQSFPVGGMLTVYKISNSGISLEEKRMIKND